MVVRGVQKCPMVVFLSRRNFSVVRFNDFDRGSNFWLGGIKFCWHQGRNIDERAGDSALETTHFRDSIVVRKLSIHFLFSDFRLGILSDHPGFVIFSRNSLIIFGWRQA